MRIRALLGLSLAFASQPGFGGDTGAVPPSPKSWFRIDTAEGQRVGFGWRQSALSDTGRTTTEVYEMRISERGNLTKQVIDTYQRHEDKKGNLVSMVHIAKSGGSIATITAMIGEETITITRQAGKDRREETIRRPKGVRFDNGAMNLRGWNPDETPELSFQNFNLQARGVENVRLRRVNDPATPPGGMTVIRSSYDGDALMSVSKLALGADRSVVSTSRPMFGTVMVIRPTDEATALDPKVPAYSVLQNAMVKSPYRILDSALQGHIRYTFRFRDGIVFDAPQTVNQKVTRNGDVMTLSICATCGPIMPMTPEIRADALRATTWMQSDHPLLRSIVGPVGKMRISDAAKMERLAVRARDVLRRTDFSGHYSALEALRRGAGDCTEDAVVLAALGRAAGIPTKVVSGLAYSRPKYHGLSNVFMPHNWTLAYADGRWQSFDMSLLGFDATHIALNISDGDSRSLSAANQLAGLLIWDKMVEVKKRPKA